jgi:integrase
MPAKRKHKFYNGRYYEWVMYQRDRVWFADGRSNSVNLGRRSLGTRDFEEAKKILEHLDLKMAVEHGLAQAEALTATTSVEISFRDGRTFYEEHVGRSRLLGGTRASSQKRYRAVLDKFLQFAKSKGLRSWNQVTAKVISNYIEHLEKNWKLYFRKPYEYATIYLEANTLKQVIGFLVKAKKLPAENKIELSLRKAHGTNTYCWQESEVKAIFAFCNSTSSLHWLHNVLFALTYTGLRISELIALRWTNVNFESGMINLVDESFSNRKREGRERQTTKGGYNRSFPIHDDLRPVLQAIAPHADGYVFHGPRGGRLKPDTVRNILIRDVLKPLATKFPTPVGERGFAHGRLHSFRHFFCSWCACRGIAQNVVMRWLGHRDSKMVEHYFHLNNEEARLQMRRLSLSESIAGASPAVGSGS